MNKADSVYTRSENRSRIVLDRVLFLILWAVPCSLYLQRSIESRTSEIYARMSCQKWANTSQLNDRVYFFSTKFPCSIAIFSSFSKLHSRSEWDLLALVYLGCNSEIVTPIFQNWAINCAWIANCRIGCFRANKCWDWDTIMDYGKFC